MPFFPIGTSSRNSPTGSGYDGTRLVNGFIQPSADPSYTQGVILGRSGFRRTVGVPAAVRGMTEHRGLLYFAAGDALYRIVESGAVQEIANIGGGANEFVRMVSTGDQLALVAGGEYYSGTAGGVGQLSLRTTGAITEPRDLAYQDGFVFVIGTAGSRNDAIQSSDLNDANTFDALDVAYAESDGDDLVGIISANRQLWLFGEKTTEFWYNAATLNFPFAPSQSAAPKVGCKAKQTIVERANIVYWVGEKNIVYRSAGGAPERISTQFEQDKLANASIRSAFTMTDRGQEFYVISLNDGPALGYSINTGQWCEFTTWDENRPWICTHSTSVGGVEYFGTNTTAIGVLRDDQFTDDGRPIRMEAVTSPVKGQGRWITLNSVLAAVSSGRTDIGRTPSIFLEVSSDGETWSHPRKRSLGRLGEYRQDIEWRGCGTHPRVQVKLWMTDPVPRDFYGIEYG